MPEGYQRNPVLVREFYNARRRQLQAAEVAPKAAHRALADLIAWMGKNFLLVTQNIDNLHERASNKRVLHMHGELLKVRCTHSGQVFDWSEELSVEDRCHCCQLSAPLRPHAVWFGEKCRWVWTKSIRRWLRLISLSPLVSLAMSIRRQALCKRHGWQGLTPWN